MIIHAFKRNILFKNTTNYALSRLQKCNVHTSRDSVVSLFNGIVKGSRADLAKSITLIETSNEIKKQSAQSLLDKILHYLKETNKLSFRIGITGPPGTGKSTLIETFGKYLTTEKKLKLAVLTVDPSSTATGGSILGDKVRMHNLANDPNAFIRSSPNKCNLGGVARNTLEAIFLCEAANYEIILVETVGVGQSEYTVANMVDCMVLLIPPGSGDELQGIKKGIAEVADLVAITKADGNLEQAARRSKMEYVSALKLMRKKSNLWTPKVVLTSAFKSIGIDELWNSLNEYRGIMVKNNELDEKRKKQLKLWFWTHLKENLIDKLLSINELKNELDRLEERVLNGTITPGQASDYIVAKFLTFNSK